MWLAENIHNQKKYIFSWIFKTEQTGKSTKTVSGFKRKTKRILRETHTQKNNRQQKHISVFKSKAAFRKRKRLKKNIKDKNTTIRHMVIDDEKYY